MVAARQRAKHIAEALGFDRIEQTRIATAVSEIARNAFMYAGGGRVEYAVEGDTAPQVLSVRDRRQRTRHRQPARDAGGRLPVAERARHRAVRRPAAGRPLLGELDVGGHDRQARPSCFPPGRRSSPGRTSPGWPDTLARRRPVGPLEEVQQQNQELLRALDDLRARQEELAARQPRARRHQPRRRRALRRARRTRRSPAARRRDQDPVPVEHDARVPDAA